MVKRGVKNEKKAQKYVKGIKARLTLRQLLDAVTKDKETNNILMLKLNTGGLINKLTKETYSILADTLHKQNSSPLGNSN